MDTLMEIIKQVVSLVGYVKDVEWYYIVASIIIWVVRKIVQDKTVKKYVVEIKDIVVVYYGEQVLEKVKKRFKKKDAK